MVNLDRASKHHHNLWKRSHKAKVTIAIGLLCKDAIIMASDSQTTYGAAKSLDTVKIAVVYFANAEVLVAQAGTADLAEKAISIMQSKAVGVKLESAETVFNIAQDAVRSVRMQLIEVNKDCGFSDDAWKRFFLEENYFELLVGFFFNRMPCLFTVNVDWGISIPVKGRFRAIGAGRTFAEYLLREYLLSDPEFDFGYAVSASVVDKTIDNIDGCGRPIWMGTVWLVDQHILDVKNKAAVVSKKPVVESHAGLVPKEEIELMASEIKISELEDKKVRGHQIYMLLQSVNKKRLAQIEEQIKKAEQGAK